jgi:hypothetical protein
MEFQSDFPSGSIMNDNRAFRQPVIFKDIHYLYAPLFVHSARKTYFISSDNHKDHEVRAREIYWAQGANFRSESTEFRVLLSNNIVLQFLQPSQFQVTEFLQQPYLEMNTKREPSSSHFHGYLTYGTLYVGLPELHPSSLAFLDTPRGHIQCMGGRAVTRVTKNFVYIEIISGTFVYNPSTSHQPAVTLTDGVVCVATDHGVSTYKNAVDFEAHNNNIALIHFDRSREKAFAYLNDEDFAIRRQNFFQIIGGEYEYPNGPVIAPPPVVSPSFHN